MEFVTLNTGAKMPIEGFGVFQVPDAAVCEQAVYDAIKTGYRLIDTAQAYMNEAAVGKAVHRAIADGLVSREELFVTTKLWVSNMKTEDGAYASLKESLPENIDEYLAMDGYRALEKAYKEGWVKAIGVSNFYPAILANFCENVEIMPAVNQVELHPFFTQDSAITLMKEYGIAPQAWGPLAEGRHGIFTHPVLAEIGAKYGKTAAQIALKWNAQRGVSILPKSVHVERMEQNFDIWDFTLSDEDMQKIAALDLGHSEIVDHSDPAFVKMINGFKI